LERNPYSPPSAHVSDEIRLATEKTPWSRVTAFYWAFLWRTILIFGGMSLPFFSVYPLFKFALNSWPRFEALFRFGCILVMLSLASSFAISWAARSSFGGCVLRTRDTLMARGSSESWPSVIPYKRAARLFASHLWRYILLLLPVNLALMRLLLGPGAPTSQDPTTILKVQAINLSIGFLVGIWAMREALNVPYPGFQFQWVAAESPADIDAAKKQSSPSVQDKL
jgi:hypothetical protein